jgi:hypothetical protein
MASEFKYRRKSITTNAKTLPSVKHLPQPLHSHRSLLLNEFSMFSILTSNIFALQFLPQLFGNGSKGVSAGHWFSKNNTVPK